MRPHVTCRRSARNRAIKPRHFEARIALIFATLFVSTGVNLPYFPLWLEAKGFDPEQIAVILSAPMFLRVVTTPLITALPDRAKDRADVLMVLVAALVAGLSRLLPSNDLRRRAGVTLVPTMVWTLHGPLADSLALSGVRRFGSNYPRMRIWGSAAFLSANSRRRRRAGLDQRRRRPGDDLDRARRDVACGSACAAPWPAAPRLAAIGRRPAGFRAQTA